MVCSVYKCYFDATCDNLLPEIGVVSEESLNGVIDFLFLVFLELFALVVVRLLTIFVLIDI